MERSRDWPASLLPEHSALQHERAPRPLPLFLELVRLVSDRDPETGRAALEGLKAYARAPRVLADRHRAEAARVGPASLDDHGGSGPPAVLIPSLINPPRVLDLDADVSLTATVARMGRRALLLDWGPARERAGLSVAGHVEELLLPLLGQLDERPALIGYCLGGTMAIAAANVAAVERVVTLAAPWYFARYPESARVALAELWRSAGETAKTFGALPMEVLQASFWSLDPVRSVTKFADFAALPPDGAEARRFVALEDWANEGEPLPAPAARELLEDFFGKDFPGNGRWRACGREVTDDLTVPLLNCTAARDRITPAATAPQGETVQMPSGHVGMIVGSGHARLHRALAGFLQPHLAADSQGH